MLAAPHWEGFGPSRSLSKSWDPRLYGSYARAASLGVIIPPPLLPVTIEELPVKVRDLETKINDALLQTEGSPKAADKPFAGTLIGVTTPRSAAGANVASPSPTPSRTSSARNASNADNDAVMTTTTTAMPIIPSSGASGSGRTAASYEPSPNTIVVHAFSFDPRRSRLKPTQTDLIVAGNLPASPSRLTNSPRSIQSGSLFTPRRDPCPSPQKQQQHEAADDQHVPQQLDVPPLAEPSSASAVTSDQQHEDEGTHTATAASNPSTMSRLTLSLSQHEQQAVATYIALETIGPQTNLAKHWATMFPDTEIEALPLDALETHREMRRRHPESDIHATRAKFLETLGLEPNDLRPPKLTHSAKAPEEQTWDDDDAANPIAWLVTDDAKRSYYGHPEDAAWVQLFQRIGRPQEDYGWLKSTYFMDDETVMELRRNQHVSGALAVPTQDVQCSSTTAAHDALDPDAPPYLCPPEMVAGSPLMKSAKQPLLVEPSAKERIMESYRRSAPRISANNDTTHRRDDVTASRDDENTARKEAIGSGETVSLTPIVPLFDASTTPTPRRRLEMPAALSSHAHSIASSVGGNATTPMGSYRYDRGPELHDCCTPTHPVNSAYVSMPITDRYRPQAPPPPPGSSSSSVLSPMPPVKSGREYRNELYRRFQFRKENGIASSPDALYSPRRPAPLVASQS